jgi:putative SOS response-associated peptidase YedK
VCGRIFVQPDLDELLGVLDALLDGPAAGAGGPRWNIAPTEPVPVLHLAGGARQLGFARWGLIPPWWSKERPPTHTFNARAEGLTEAPTFRGALRSGRVVVPVSGFYEWRTVDGARAPVAIRGPGPVLGLGGLCATRRGPDGPSRSATVITTAASPAMAEIHDRMPVLLPPEVWDMWMNPDVPFAELSPWLQPSSLALHIEPVGSAVGNARDKSGSWMVA